MFSRREFGKIALAGVPATIALAKIDSKVQGVQIGAQTYSFRELGMDDAVNKVIKAMTEVGLGECEVFGQQIESGAPEAARTPFGQRQTKEQREELRKWRLSVPMDYFKGVAQKFHTAGINIHGYNMSFNDSFTDDEIDRSFDMAKALGAKFITSSTTLPVAKRVVPFAEKHKMTVAMHGHSDLKDPNQFAKPESFEAAMAMSKYFAINLDIGHFTAAGYDPVEYIKQHHSRITNIHLKDRKKDNGPNTVWGEGDTPIKAVLQLLKKEKYPIYADIEYEYKGAGTPVEEVKKCYEYIKSALA